nr:hypothetical protein OG409_01710 [Streptomyces sp. NBC_00974]
MTGRHSVRRDAERRESSGRRRTLGNLPSRQFDVVVLRYIAKYDTKHISWYMGITPSAVDYHCREDRERLSPLHRRDAKQKQEETP